MKAKSCLDNNSRPLRKVPTSVPTSSNNVWQSQHTSEITVVVRGVGGIGITRRGTGGSSAGDIRNRRRVRQTSGVLEGRQLNGTVPCIVFLAQLAKVTSLLRPPCSRFECFEETAETEISVPGPPRQSAFVWRNWHGKVLPN